MPTIAERLGFAAGDRVAIVHADDLGMCHAANRGGFEALEAGVVTCGSIMVPCPWFEEAAELARANPALDLGVHLTLNAEWTHYRWGPVAGRRAVPSLLDAQGYLPRSVPEVGERAKPEEAHVELRAQVQMALDAGIDVTHLDTHMGTLFLPSMVEVYAALAEEFRLPVFAPRPDRDALAAIGLKRRNPSAKRMVEVLDRLESAGFPLLDGFDADSLGFAEGQGVAHNHKRLAALREGVHYLICHPASDGDELRRVTPDSAHHRDFERDFWSAGQGARAIEEEGIRTVGMRPLRDLLRAEA